jgi:hypothetical protein
VSAADAKERMSKAMDLLDERCCAKRIGRYARDAMADYTIEENSPQGRLGYMQKWVRWDVDPHHKPQIFVSGGL